jgi:hypothetical protein
MHGEKRLCQFQHGQLLLFAWLDTRHAGEDVSHHIELNAKMI